MAIKTLATMRADAQLKALDTATYTSAQVDGLLNEALRSIWEARTDWTIRLSGTQTGLTGISTTGTTTAGSAYGSRIESVHALYRESTAGGVTSVNQLERLELSEFVQYALNDVDGNAALVPGAPEFYAREPLAADTDTTAGNHGLWKFYFLNADGTARHYSMRARLRYTALSGNTDVPDCPDSWCDVASTLAAAHMAQGLGRSELAQQLLARLPEWAEQFARRRAESAGPRGRPGEAVPR